MAVNNMRPFTIKDMSQAYADGLKGWQRPMKAVFGADEAKPRGNKTPKLPQNLQLFGDRVWPSILAR